MPGPAFGTKGKNGERGKELEFSSTKVRGDKQKKGLKDPQAAEKQCLAAPLLFGTFSNAGKKEGDFKKSKRRPTGTSRLPGLHKGRVWGSHKVLLDSRGTGRPFLLKTDAKPELAGNGRRGQASVGSSGTQWGETSGIKKRVFCRSVALCRAAVLHYYQARFKFSPRAPGRGVSQPKKTMSDSRKGEVRAGEGMEN